MNALDATDEERAAVRAQLARLPDYDRVWLDVMTGRGADFEVISDARAEAERVAGCRRWLKRSPGRAWSRLSWTRYQPPGNPQAWMTRWEPYRAELSRLDEQTLWSAAAMMERAREPHTDATCPDCGSLVTTSGACWNACGI